MEEHNLTPEILKSREFYDTLRREVVPCITLVAVCDYGKVYFWDDFGRVARHSISGLYIDEQYSEDIETAAHAVFWTLN